jgi:acyl carrier protein
MKSVALDARIVAILSRASLLPPEAFARDATLDSLGLGSLERIECVLELEDELQVELRDQDLWKLRTVGDVFDAIRRAVGVHDGNRPQP